MTYTSDQYEGFAKLDKWYHKSVHQIIQVSGVVGTGMWQLIEKFLDYEGIDMKEVMFLSYDQKQVLEMASKKYHAYYINGIIYNYIRLVDFDTIPVLNPKSNKLEYQWKKKVRKKIDPRYRIMVVFDSILLDQDTIDDLQSFGLPIILLNDPMKIPASFDSCTLFRKANVRLREAHPDQVRNPIIHFAHKVLLNEKLKIGNYDNVSIVSRKQMNLYNFKSANIILTMTDSVRDQINETYRDRIMHRKDIINVVGERVIVMNNMYAHKITNKDEEHIKVYLTKGTVGTLTKCNKHALNTRYVPIEFKPDFYFDRFDDLIMDRHYLNRINLPTKQIIPDETILLQYAYALTVPLARLSHWDKVTLMVDRVQEAEDDELYTRLMYTAITSARSSLTIVI